MLPCEAWFGPPTPDLQASQVQGGAEGSHARREALPDLLILLLPVQGLLLVGQGVQILQVPGSTSSWNCTLMVSGYDKFCHICKFLMLEVRHFVNCAFW